MPVRLDAAAIGRRRGRRLVVELCREAEAARLERGLSYAELGRAVRLSGWQVARILQGRSPDVALVRLSELLAIVGLDLAARAFPGGAPIRDAAHVALLGRLRERLSPALAWRVEVPVVPLAVAGEIDRRAWDATIGGRDWTVGVEAETRVADVQALERRIALKQRDGAVACVVLLLNDTKHNRRIADEGALRAAFPGTARATLSALGRGRPPAQNSMILL